MRQNPINDRDVTPTYPGDMLTIIKHGLNRTGKAKRILILGAGMAGLVAGSLLKQAGHQVILLEGNDRVGGRVFTMRKPFSTGNYLEAGAMRIPSEHKLTLEYIRKFNLPLNSFINSTPNDYLYVNGVKTRRSSYERSPSILKSPVKEEYRNKTALDIFLEVVQPFLDIYNRAPPQEQIKLKEEYDTYSFGSFLRNNPFGNSLDLPTIHLIQVMLGIEGFPELSFIDILTDVVSTIFNGEIDYYEITGGNDLLPWSFMKELCRDVHFNQTVTQINQSGGKVEVSTRDSRTWQNHLVQADYVITTIPFSVFQFVRLLPSHSFSFYKRSAIQALHYVPSTKIGLEFNHKFWEGEGIYGGSLTTDLPLQFSYYPSHDLGKPGPGVMLGSYSWEDNAALWDALPEQLRIHEALRMLSYVHGPVVFSSFMQGASFSWAQNQFSGGCFTLFKPYHFRDYGEVIRMPEGRVHFAGEHTSSFHGWIEGAVQSGIRAAWEVNNRTR
ncbi:flavin monoamine oxidase family protein [Pseudalkalibacillus sp. SCS-8]|uniref:flavin monoamine oxidase family protein n=1 Tax=Pseudalkalibacillus nanhaiensis TaxID=3115291 RepID=UPI0032DBB29D